MNPDALQVQVGNELVDWADFWAAHDEPEAPAVSTFSAADLEALERINQALRRVEA